MIHDVLDQGSRSWVTETALSGSSDGLVARTLSVSHELIVLEALGVIQATPPPYTPYK
jgi:hypothetical protein